MRLQRLETPVPFGTERRHPQRRRLERRRRQAVARLAPLPGGLDQPRVGQRGQVLRDRLPRDRQPAGELGLRERPVVGEQARDLTPGRVGEGGEDRPRLSVEPASQAAAFWSRKARSSAELRVPAELVPLPRLGAELQRSRTPPASAACRPGPPRAGSPRASSGRLRSRRPAPTGTRTASGGSTASTVTRVVTPSSSHVNDPSPPGRRSSSALRPEPAGELLRLGDRRPDRLPRELERHLSLDRVLHRHRFLLVQLVWLRNL